MSFPRVARVAARAAAPLARRASLVCTTQTRFAAAAASTSASAASNSKASKYADVYKSDFEGGSYPIALPGGVYVTFAKLLFRFAADVDGKNFGAYLSAFDSLRTFNKSVGPMWPLEEDLWKSENPTVKKLPEGFRFVISWMQTTKNMNLLPQVEAAFRELVDESQGTTTAFLTFASEPSSADFAKAQKEAQSTFSSEIKNRSVNWVSLIDPSLISGYTLNIESGFVDKSGRGEQLASASKKEVAVDYTRVPGRAYRKTPNVSSDAGAAFAEAYSYLSGLDEAEWSHGY